MYFKLMRGLRFGIRIVNASASDRNTIQGGVQLKKQKGKCEPLLRGMYVSGRHMR